MAEEIIEKATTTTAAKKKNKMLSIAAIGIFTLLVTILLIGGLVFLTGKNTGKVKRVADIGPLVSVGEDIVVNLTTAEDRLERYLKVNVILEASNEKVKQELTKRNPQIRDLIINILSSKNKDNLDKKEGKELVRREIINAVNSHLNSGKVKNLFFRDFVIQ